MKRTFCFLLFILLTACSPATPASTPQFVTVFATSAAEPWLAELYDCAAQASVTVSRSPDDQTAQIALWLGEPENLTTPAFEIDTEEILVVTHRQSPVQDLTLDAARALFSGQGDPSVQVWVYASDADVQRAFDQLVMAGRGVTSFARLAVSPQHMSDVLNAESNAVGILPRRWKAGEAREVYTAGALPVLAVTKTRPEGKVKELIACLQK